jgi:hypothetical protein
MQCGSASPRHGAADERSQGLPEPSNFQLVAAFQVENFTGLV